MHLPPAGDSVQQSVKDMLARSEPESASQPKVLALVAIAVSLSVQELI